MPKRSLLLTGSVFVISCLARSASAAQPPDIFGACASLGTLPTVYFSGVFQGPASAGAAFKTGFAEFLRQRYGYNGAVLCAPANSAANAMNIIKTQSTALRNAKKIVIETGWTQPLALAGLAGAVPAMKAQGAMMPAAPPAAGAAPGAPGAGLGGAGGGNGGSGGSGGAASPWTTLLRTVLGGGGGGSGSGPSTGASSGASKGGASGGAAGGQGSNDQVANALASAFSATKSSQQGLPDGALGAAQWQTTRLVVFGCGRQGKQVACINELTNQNQKDTLVQADDVWKDAFLVDDRGDRHQRSSGFFLNLDGDQRSQLDISYGKTARFVLLFDEVQTRVQKVALRSGNGGLDVEEIRLIDAGAGSQGAN